MRDWILFGITVFGFAAGVCGAWFGLSVRVALAPLREKVLVLEADLKALTARFEEEKRQTDQERAELLQAMREGFKALGDRIGTEVTRLDKRLDVALRGKEGSA